MHRESQDSSKTHNNSFPRRLRFGFCSLFCNWLPDKSLSHNKPSQHVSLLQVWKCGVCLGVVVFSLFLTAMGKDALDIMTKLYQWSWCMREFTNWLRTDKLEG